MKYKKSLIVLISFFIIGAISIPIFTQAAPAQKLDFYMEDFLIYENITVTLDMKKIDDYQCTHIITVGYIDGIPIEGHLDTY